MWQETTLVEDGYFSCRIRMGMTLQATRVFSRDVLLGGKLFLWGEKM